MDEQPVTVLVTSRSFSSGTLDLEARLRSHGLTVRRAAARHDADELAGCLPDAVAWIAGTGPIGTAHLKMAPGLRVIARYGVGLDSVDLGAAARAGVIVTNTPGANSASVAEHTIALLLAALRGIPAGDARVRRGEWSASRGRLIRDAVAGIVGFGNIGRETSWRLAALGCRVLVHDPYMPAQEIADAGYEPATLGQVREIADLVCLHSPGGPPIVDAAWTRTARPGQVIVNAARAELVDEAAVDSGLRRGRLFAYAADTLDCEATGPASYLLAEDLAERVALTPHLGGQTVEAVDRMGAMAVDAVLDVLVGRRPDHVVGAAAEAARD